MERRIYVQYDGYMFDLALQRSDVLNDLLSNQIREDTQFSTRNMHN